MNLPDYLPGYPPMYGVKQELPQHYQGDEIVIPLDIITNNEYELRAYLRDSLSTPRNIWVGVQDNGIETVNGNVLIRIKASESKLIPSGTYYLSVTGARLQDIGNANTLILEKVSITPAASSPYPIINE